MPEEPRKPKFDPCAEMERLRREREQLLIALGRVDGAIHILQRICREPMPAPTNNEEEDE